MTMKQGSGKAAANTEETGDRGQKLTPVDTLPEVQSTEGDYGKGEPIAPGAIGQSLRDQAERAAAEREMAERRAANLAEGLDEDGEKIPPNDAPDGTPDLHADDPTGHGTYGELAGDDDARKGVDQPTG